MKERISSLKFFVWLISSFYTTFYQIMQDVVCSQIYYTCIRLSLINHIMYAHYANDYSFDSWWNSGVNHIFFPMISFCLSLYFPSLPLALQFLFPCLEPLWWAGQNRWQDLQVPHSFLHPFLFLLLNPLFHIRIWRFEWCIKSFPCSRSSFSFTK